MIDWRLTLEDGEFWLEVRETVECVPDRGLVLLSQDDDEGLPAAVTECDLRHDPPQHLVVGPELQPAGSGCQDSPRVYLHVMEQLHCYQEKSNFSKQSENEYFNFQLHFTFEFLVYFSTAPDGPPSGIAVQSDYM